MILPEAAVNVSIVEAMGSMSMNMIIFASAIVLLIGWTFFLVRHSEKRRKEAVT